MVSVIPLSHSPKLRSDAIWISTGHLEGTSDPGFGPEEMQPGRMGPITRGLSVHRKDSVRRYIAIAPEAGAGL